MELGSVFWSTILALEGYEARVKLGQNVLFKTKTISTSDIKNRLKTLLAYEGCDLKGV